MVVATYDVDIDTDGSETFAEDVLGAVSTNPPGQLNSRLFTAERGRDQARMLAPPRAGKASLFLDNLSGNYGPTSGVQAGRLVRVRATDPTTATVHDVHLGILDKPEHLPATQFVKIVSLKTKGTLSRLAGKQISTALYSAITTDVAIGHLLDAIGWPAGGSYRALDVGKTTLAWWWLDKQDAMQALVELLNSEGPGAAVYEDGAGRLVFKNRHARVTEARSTAVQTTFRSSGAEPLIEPPFVYDPGLQDVINVCSITVKTRAAQSSAQVWALGSTVTLSPGESISFTARQSDGDPFTAAVTPTSGGGDFVVSSGSLSSVTLDRTSGASVTVALVAGGSGAVVTGLRLRAQSVEVTNTTTRANTVDTSASRAQYGDQTPPSGWRVRAEIAVETAQDFVNAVVGFYQNGRPTAQLAVMANGDAARMTAALAREVGDRVRVIEENTPIDEPFTVEQVRHEITSPSTHITYFGLELASGADYGVWGTAIWGTSVWGF